MRAQSPLLASLPYHGPAGQDNLGTQAALGAIEQIERAAITRHLAADDRKALSLKHI